MTSYRRLHRNRTQYKSAGHPMFGRCSYPLIHTRHHHPHPGPFGPKEKPRLVCHICHPPAPVIRARQAVVVDLPAAA